MDLKGRPACGVPAVLSSRPHRTGRFQPPRPPLFGTRCGVARFRGDLRGALAPYGRARLVVAGGRLSSGPAVRRLTEPFERSPAAEAAARVGRYRAPAAGPPPLRLHDPVRTRLLAGGERRQMTMAGNRCQGLFSRNRQRGSPLPNGPERERSSCAKRNRVREAPFAAEPAEPSVLRPVPRPCRSPVHGRGRDIASRHHRGCAAGTESAFCGPRVTPHPDGSAVSTSPSGRGKGVFGRGQEPFFSTFQNTGAGAVR